MTISGKNDPIFDLPTHLISVIGPEGTFLRTNIAQLHLLGWDPSDLIGQPVTDYVHPEDAEKTLNQIDRLHTEGGVVTDFRNRCTHRDGGFRWISWSGSIKDGLIYCIGIDVTAQIAAEEKVLFTENQMAAFFESLPAIVWITSAEGAPQYYNQAWYAFTGLPPETTDVSVVRDCTHPEDHEQMFVKFEEALRTGTKYETQVRIRRRDGVYRWHLARSFPIKDMNGKVLRWVGTSTDIHDQVSTTERLHSLFMQAPACITIHSGPKHVYEFSNEMNNRMLGRTDLLGRTVAEIMGPDTETNAVPLLDSVYQTGQSLIYDEYPVARDWTGTGTVETKYLGVVIQATRAVDGMINGVMTFSVDMTAQVLARAGLEAARKKAEDANRAKTEFLANMSHEIRTPLTAVIGFAELAMDSPDTSPPVKRFLNRILANAEQLTSLIGDILDLSKIEASGLDLTHEDISLIHFIEDVFSSAMGLAKTKGLHLSFEIADGTPPTLRSDPTRLRQILQNVLGNAIKFTLTGEVRLKASVGSDHLFTFDIEDTGIGIEETAQIRLFQPFSQGDSSTSRKFGGTGLGLALSRKLAGALGGDVSILRTTVGQGTTFRITVMDRSEDVSQRLVTDMPSNADGTRIKVLLVEDSPDNQLLFTEVLKTAGVSVDVAENGEVGLRMAMAHDYQVILMDLHMPVMDGYAATAALRVNGYKKKIVALTAHALQDERERALAAGFDDYLTKPINREALIRAIVRHRE